MKFGTILILLILVVGGIWVYNNYKGGGNPSDKSACENSGGTYSQGFSETGGAYRYCACPSDKYASSNICYPITTTQTKLCTDLTNSCVICNDKDGSCECAFRDSNTKSYLSYGQLQSMSCGCNQDICGCMGGGMQFPSCSI